MQQPGREDITIYKGSTFSLLLQCKDNSGNAVTLTGYTARLQVRESVDATEKLLELTTENGGISIAGSTGEITLSMSATATAALTWIRGVYDLEIVGGSAVTRIVEGNITVEKEVTR